VSKKARARRDAKAAARAEKIERNERIASIQASRRSWATSEVLGRVAGLAPEDMVAAEQRLVDAGLIRRVGPVEAIMRELIEERAAEEGREVGELGDVEVLEGDL
jgi:hypothetical protein